jgi:hypothetical protein
MKKFLINISFFILPVFLFFLLGLFLPTTPRASKSLLMAMNKKNDLLRTTKNPRIIFVGGSNISFGLNSQIIKDSLKLNPINTSIHASIGIKFMIDNTLDYIQKGDVVVLIPEYTHYYRSLNFGSEELMRIIFDVNLKNIKYLNLSQITNILTFLPNYSLKKFKTKEYFNFVEDDIYSLNSFNNYGDTYSHWNLKKTQDVPPEKPNDKFNEDIIKYFEDFNNHIKNKKASLFVSFPCLQESSFNISKTQILKVESELLKSNLKIIGSANRYKIPDSLIFNTPYHLIKKGVDYRTKLLIQDLKKELTIIKKQ